MKGAVSDEEGTWGLYETATKQGTCCMQAAVALLCARDHHNHESNRHAPLGKPYNSISWE